eukprot:7012542-Alexandrium_andersonii.AAC.1
MSLRVSRSAVYVSSTARPLNHECLALWPSQHERDSAAMAAATAAEPVPTEGFSLQQQRRHFWQWRWKRHRWPLQRPP